MLALRKGTNQSTERNLRIDNLTAGRIVLGLHNKSSMDVSAVLKSVQDIFSHPVYSWIAVSLLFVVVFLIATIIRDAVKSSRIGCDGPPGFPIVGHIPYLLSEPWVQFFRYYQKYGGVYKM